MNPTVATFMLFLHVLAALWLAGGVFAGSVVRAQGRKAKSLGERALALRIAWRLVNVFSLPGAVAVGIYLTTSACPKPRWKRACSRTAAGSSRWRS